MNTVAIIPAKPFDQGKQRLAPVVGTGHRRALIEAMFSDSMRAVRKVHGFDQVLVVTADRTAAQIAEADGAIVIEDTASSHSEAAQLGITRALALGARRALLLPGDCPLIDATEIEQLLAYRAAERSVLIVPDRQGDGTNALLLTPPDAMPPSFGEGSRQRHVELARAHGATPEVIEVPCLSLDIDTPEDLDELQQRFAAKLGLAAHTRGMLSQLIRSQTA